MRQLFHIKREADRALVLSIVRSAPLGCRVEVKETKRTLPQNDLFYGLLTDVARQKPHINGIFYPPEIWKLIFLHALGQETPFMPSLDGRTMFPMGRSSSELTKDEMSELITFIIAWGDQNGVIFTQKPPPAEPAR